MSDIASALIVDDHELFRRGLKLLLQDMAGIEEVVEAGSLDEAQSAIASDQAPGLVTFDLNVPGLSGLEGLSALLEAVPTSPVVVISASEERDDILGALLVGAQGYIPKSLPAPKVADAIAQVLAGQIYTPRALQKSIKDLAGLPAPAPTMPGQRISANRSSTGRGRIAANGRAHAEDCEQARAG